MTHDRRPQNPLIAPGASEDDQAALDRVDLFHINEAARLAAQRLTDDRAAVVYLVPGDMTQYVITVVRERDARINVREDKRTTLSGGAHRVFVSCSIGGGQFMWDDMLNDPSPDVGYVRATMCPGDLHTGAVLAQFIHRLFEGYRHEIAELDKLDLFDAATNEGGGF